MNRILLAATLVVVLIGLLAMYTSKPVEPVKSVPVVEESETDRILSEVLYG